MTPSIFTTWIHFLAWLCSAMFSFISWNTTNWHSIINIMLCSSKRLEVHLDQLLLPNPTIGGFSTSNLQLDLATKFQSYQESKVQSLKPKLWRVKVSRYEKWKLSDKVTKFEESKLWRVKIKKFEAKVIMSQSFKVIKKQSFKVIRSQNYKVWSQSYNESKFQSLKSRSLLQSFKVTKCRPELDGGESQVLAVAWVQLGQVPVTEGPIRREHPVTWITADQWEASLTWWTTCWTWPCPPAAPWRGCPAPGRAWCPGWSGYIA